MAAPQIAVPAAAAPASEAEPSANLSFEPVAPGDLLFVYVSNSPENTRSVRISADGTISLPSLKNPVQVTGLLSTEIEKVIVSALIVNKILVEPIVSVSVVEYRSKPITVVGAVHDPVTIQAIGNLHLLDAIAKAGGLAPEAGSLILVSKPGINGAADSVQQIPTLALMGKPESLLNLSLTGGENIRVPVAAKFYVVGNVKTPGSYPMTDGATTVLKALALCQGTLTFTQPEAYVYRADPDTQARHEIAVPLRRIMRRQAADFPLEADDIFYVPDSPGKRLTARVLERVAIIGGSTASAVLVYDR
jgi:polysaccharide export outer membrane protein